MFVLYLCLNVFQGNGSSDDGNSAFVCPDNFDQRLFRGKLGCFGDLSNGLPHNGLYCCGSYQNFVVVERKTLEVFYQERLLARVIDSAEEFRKTTLPRPWRN